MLRKQHTYGGLCAKIGISFPWGLFESLYRSNMASMIRAVNTTFENVITVMLPDYNIVSGKFNLIVIF